MTNKLSQMLSDTMAVITNPSVASFERLENKGTLQDAMLYVGLCALISGLFGLSGGVMGLLSGVLSTLVGFGVFTYLVHTVGKGQGGTGSLDQVAYTFSLFWVPLSVVGAVIALILTITIIGIFLLPLVGIGMLLLQVMFAYLAVQSSMNLQAGKPATVTLVVAFLGTLVVKLVLSAIF